MVSRGLVIPKTINFGSFVNWRIVGKSALIILLVFQYAFCQEPVFQHLTTADGLSSNTVNCIMQDQLGFMWFGTSNGLNRYDGYQFVAFRRDADDPQSLSDNTVLSLVQDSAGFLWVGTSKGGLNRFDPRQQTFSSWQNNPENPHSLSHNQIAALALDTSQQLWIGTVGGGLNRMKLSNAGVFEHWRHKEGDSTSLSDNFIPALLVDREGQLWIATVSGGLNLLVNAANGIFRSWQQIPANDGPRHFTTVGCLMEDSNGGLWMGNSLGIVRFNKDFSQIRLWAYDRDNSAGINDQRIISLNHTQNPYNGEVAILAGTFSGGVNRLNTTTGEISHWKHASANAASLGDNNVKTAYQSRDGTIWIATLAGLSKKQPQRRGIVHWYHDPTDSTSLSANYVWPIYETPDNRIWVGTVNGLNEVDPNTGRSRHWKHSPDNQQSLSGNAILSLWEDDERYLWVGTFQNGLNRLNRKTGKVNRWRHNPDDVQSLSNNSIYQLKGDAAGRLWIGTQNGLNRINPNIKRGNALQFTRYENRADDPHGISHNHITAVFEDSNRRLWIGTYGGGLNLYDEAAGRFRSWQHDPNSLTSISHNSIAAITETPLDSGSAIWVATEGGGLNRFDPQREIFDRYTENEGLAGNVIQEMLTDKSGFLWFTSGGQVTQLNPHNSSFQHFDPGSIVGNLQFNPFAALCSEAGAVFFGSDKGVISFLPAEMLAKRSGPTTILTDFRIFHEPVTINAPGLSPLSESVAYAKNISLSHRDNMFSFSFAVPDYAVSNQNRFEYQLQGFHDQWINLGRKNNISFTNLDPGEYVFRVRGINSEGTPDLTGATIAINVMPPFWKTWWFRLLAALLLVTVLYGFFRARVNSILQIERARTRIARDLHDDISSTLSSIHFFGNAVEEQLGDAAPEDSRRFLKLIVNAAKDTQEKIRDIIWAIDPEHDDLFQLLARFQRYASDVFESQGIAYRIEIEGQPEQKQMAMENRQNVWLIYKEIINNALRHSQATGIDIRISVDKEFLQLVIRDNGIGFEPHSVDKGNGLKNIYSRAALLKAKAELTSAAGSGTTWTIRVPIK